MNYLNRDDKHVKVGDKIVAIFENGLVASFDAVLNVNSGACVTPFGLVPEGRSMSDQIRLYNQNEGVRCVGVYTFCPIGN